MSINIEIWQICLLYRSRNLLILYSPRSSVALFSGPDLLLAVPHCHDTRHAVNLIISGGALLGNYVYIHSPYCHPLRYCSAAGRDAGGSRGDVDASSQPYSLQH